MREVLRAESSTVRADQLGSPPLGTGGSDLRVRTRGSSAGLRRRSKVSVRREV